MLRRVFGISQEHIHVDIAVARVSGQSCASAVDGRSKEGGAGQGWARRNVGESTSQCACATYIACTASTAYNIIAGQCWQWRLAKEAKLRSPHGDESHRPSCETKTIKTELLEDMSCVRRCVGGMCTGYNCEALRRRTCEVAGALATTAAATVSTILQSRQICMPSLHVGPEGSATH